MNMSQEQERPEDLEEHRDILDDLACTQFSSDPDLIFTYKSCA